MTRRRHPTSSAATGRGFTLIELMIAISLMAVLAVLGWRGLDSVLRSRERIVEASDGIRAVSLAFAQMEDDLLRSWSVRLLVPSVRPVAFVFEQVDGPPDLFVLREPSAATGGEVQRIVYRVRDGRLERGFGPWRLPRPDDGSRAGEQPLTWQTLIEGVSGLRLSGHVDGRGWQPAQALAARPGAAQDAAPMTGVEVLLEQRNGERVLRVFSVKD